MSKAQPLFVCALAEELEGHQALVTGVGKVNATYALTRYLATQPLPDFVINLGSAGGIGVPSGKMAIAVEFHQWDMRCEGLGLDRGVTPFDKVQAILKPTHQLSGRGIFEMPCYTSDMFLDDPAKQPPGPCVVDMEAYALAKVCAAFQVPFAAMKFITDGADGSAGEDWQTALKRCSESLSAIIKFYEHAGTTLHR